MFMSFNVELPNLEIPKRQAKKMSKEVLFRAMVKMEELAKNRAPVDTGNLKNRIHLSPMARGRLKYVLSDGVEYGIDLEYGNRPRIVPLIDLKEWVERKGIATEDDAIAFAKYVKEKIAKEGVNPQPFFRPAYHEVKNYWLPIIKDQVMKKYFGGT